MLVQCSAILTACLLLAACASSPQQPDAGPRRFVLDRSYKVSLPETWEEHADWSMAENMAAPGRPFALSDCHAWMNQQTKALLQICSDRNWLAGKSLAEIEHQFLSPASLLPGRSFLAENLKVFFFPFSEDFNNRASPFLSRVIRGTLTEDDIKSRLIVSDRHSGLMAFLVKLDPTNVLELYGTFISPGYVDIVHKGTLTVDVAFPRHRFGSLGVVQTPRHKWVAFVLASEESIPAHYVKQFGLPADSEGKRIRFLWLVGAGAQDLQETDRMVHVVLAEIWDGTSTLGSLAEILGGLTIGQTEAHGQAQVSAAPLTPIAVEPHPWHVNDESWKARLGVVGESPEPLRELPPHDFLVDMVAHVAKAMGWSLAYENRKERVFIWRLEHRGCEGRFAWYMKRIGNELYVDDPMNWRCKGMQGVPEWVQSESRRIQEDFKLRWRILVGPIPLQAPTLETHSPQVIGRAFAESWLHPLPAK